MTGIDLDPSMNDIRNSNLPGLLLMDLTSSCITSEKIVLYVSRFSLFILITVTPDSCLLGCIFLIIEYPHLVGVEYIDTWRKVSEEG